MSCYTSVVWMFRFPDMMACSVGYLIQNSEHHGETTCLGKQNNDHQKAFTALLGAHSSICTGSYMISFVVLCHARYHYVTSYCDIIPDIIEVYHTQISLYDVIL